MAFKPFCVACQTWHTDEEGHVGGSLVLATKPSMSIDDKLDALMQKVNKIEEDLFKLRNELSMTFGDEFNPKRAELSKELAGRMLTKLKGEFRAREMTAPSGAYWCNACSTAHPGDFVCLECLNRKK